MMTDAQERPVVDTARRAERQPEFVQVGTFVKDADGNYVITYFDDER